MLRLYIKMPVAQKMHRKVNGQNSYVLQLIQQQTGAAATRGTGIKLPNMTTGWAIYACISNIVQQRELLNLENCEVHHVR